MMTTFDRYLIVRFLQTFAILFVSVYGLYIVIDGLSNIDEFSEHAKGTWGVISQMGSYYGYQATWFFDLCGPILTVADAMIVFALLLRNSELYPILAAGVPASRLLIPVVASTALINGLLVLNQELVIPRIANILQAPRDALLKGEIEIEPLTDQTSGIYISGRELALSPKQLIKNAEFVLPPGITHVMTTVNAAQAGYHPAKGNQPAGWLLESVEIPYTQLALTDEGRKFVRRMQDPKSLFIVSELSFDQLFNRSQSFRLLSTSELVHRLQSPAFGQVADRGLAQHLHARLVRPFANLFAMLVAVPLIIRKESRWLVTNMAIAAAVLGVLLGVSETVAYFGRAGVLSPEVSAWIPVFVTAMVFCRLTSVMLT